MEIKKAARIIEVTWDNSGGDLNRAYSGLERDAFLSDNPGHADVADECWPNWKLDDYLPPQPLPPSNEETIAVLTAALEAHYDTTAQVRRYDNRLTCAVRAGYPGPFQAEGLAFALWMDGCNAYAYQVMADCIAGKREVPIAEALIAELPAIVWPP